MKNIKDYLMITLGSILVAIAVFMFLAPNEIAAGGVSGIAIILIKFFPWMSISLVSLVLNVILFIMAFLILGNGFGAKTIYASGVIVASYYILELLVPENYVITDNIVIAAISATLLTGAGLGTVFRYNASTGGTDIIAKIVNKFFKMPMGISLIIVDMIVTIFAFFAFGAEKALIGVLVILANGSVIDYVITGFKIKKQVMIFTTKKEEIKEYITINLNRGCTILNGTGGFTGKEAYIIYTVLGRNEFIKLRNFIGTIDKKAFITVSEVHEVLGEGFEELIER